MNWIREHWGGITLCILTLFAFCLRICQLDYQCLMVDETVTSNIAKMTTMEIFKWAMQVDCNPPLYYLLAHWFSLVFGGITDFAIRFPSVILGTITVPLSYLVGKTVKSKTLGLLLASIVAFLFPYVLYSQNARGYMLVFVAFLCFTYFWIRVMDGDNGIETFAGLSICAAFCLWSHYYSVVPMAVMIAILLWEHQIDIYECFFCGSLLVCLTSPLILSANWGNLIARSSPALITGFSYSQLTPDKSTWITPIQMAIYLPNEIMCWSWIVFVPLIGYAVYRSKDKFAKYLTLTALITCITLIPLCYFTNLMMRYALLVSPLLILVALYPVSDIIERQPNAKKAAVLFIGFVFLIAAFNFFSLFSWFTFNLCPLINETVKVGMVIPK